MPQVETFFGMRIYPRSRDDLKERAFRQFVVAVKQEGDVWTQVLAVSDAPPNVTNTFYFSTPRPSDEVLIVVQRTFPNADRGMANVAEIEFLTI